MSCCSHGPKYAVFEGVKINSTTKFYFFHGNGTPNDFERHRRDFILTDTALQRTLIRTWKWAENKTPHACGNSYDIYIIWNEKERKVAGINSECKAIYVDGRLLQFDPEYLEKIDSNLTVNISRSEKDSILDFFRHGSKDSKLPNKNSMNTALNAPLKIGDEIELSGGYDIDPVYLAKPKASKRSGTIIQFIKGQHESPAAVVKLSELVSGEKITGNIFVLELRYVEQTWSQPTPVHIELCNFMPENKPLRERKQGEWVEAAATIKLVKAAN